ncbi:MAG: phosphomannomutase [Proteobacteria bacterium]|nr:phosphomannomutase [Pseudomonadota bacterium]
MSLPDTPSPLTLAQALDHTPRALQFGTSGRRGDVQDLTQLEIYINARAQLEYLQHLPREQGGIVPGDAFCYAHDLRPSSTRYVAEQGGRGELAQAIEQAVVDAGMRPLNLGEIPTPALCAYAMARGLGSMMVTGSHIPFHRNGYKTNSAKGELLKTDEAPIGDYVERWRARIYGQSTADSLFGADGRFKSGSRPCQPPQPLARQEYLARYSDFFGPNALGGLRVLVYQHSAVGRDLLVEALHALGAEAMPIGRSETFVPIDTEAIDAETLANVRSLAQRASIDGARYHAVVSTDGDSDRPLLVGLSYREDGHCLAKFYPGDLVGMVVALHLKPDAVVVPISCNDAIDTSALAPVLAPKTRIGSPYVIAGMIEAGRLGATRICGWEANGGFLTGSDFTLTHASLPALPTRDAFLPVLSVLAQMADHQCSMDALFSRLPARYSRAGLLRECPRAVSQQVIESFTVQQDIAAHTARYFQARDGFTALERIDHTDGVRMYFSNGDVAHIRPSGNADELRIYAVAATQQRADEIVEIAVSAPDGILLRLCGELKTS